MQQIYRRIPLLKCDFNKVAKLLVFVTRGTWFTPSLLFSNSQGYSYSFFIKLQQLNFSQIYSVLLNTTVFDQRYLFYKISLTFVFYSVVTIVKYNWLIHLITHFYYLKYAMIIWYKSWHRQSFPEHKRNTKSLKTYSDIRRHILKAYRYVLDIPCSPWSNIKPKPEILIFSRSSLRDNICRLEKKIVCFTKARPKVQTFYFWKLKTIY